MLLNPRGRIEIQTFVERWLHIKLQVHFLLGGWIEILGYSRKLSIWRVLGKAFDIWQYHIWDENSPESCDMAGPRCKKWKRSKRLVKERPGALEDHQRLIFQRHFNHFSFIINLKKVINEALIFPHYSLSSLKIVPKTALWLQGRR